MVSLIAGNACLCWPFWKETDKPRRSLESAGHARAAERPISADQLRASSPGKTAATIRRPPPPAVDRFPDAG